jgi:hypothetical protein
MFVCTSWSTLLQDYKFDHDCCFPFISCLLNIGVYVYIFFSCYKPLRPLEEDKQEQREAEISEEQ